MTQISKYILNLKKYIHKTNLFFDECLKIKDKKNSEIVTFKTNRMQDKIIEVIDNHYADYPDPTIRPTLYIIILKARQQGASTVTESIFFKAITIGMPGSPPNNKVAMVVSYDEESSKIINEMSDRFYQNMPQDIKPKKRASLGKGLILENPDFDPTQPRSTYNNPGLQSKFLIATANNKNVGSGSTINYLHVSELGKWGKDAATSMQSVMQAVPKINGVVIVESTAQGENFFKDIWDNTVAGENDYVHLFFPWFEHAEYTEPFNNEHERSELKNTLDKEELDLIRVYGVSLEQLNWRRKTIANKFNGELDRFHEDYPAYHEQAFLTSGSPVFQNQIVSTRKKELIEKYKINKPLVGNFVYEYENEKIKNKIKFVEDPNGYLTIYEQPQTKTPYVIGGDIAEGGKDYSVGQVINNITGNQAAVWRGRMDTDLYAKQMYCLGKYYNNALISIEMNLDLHPVKELQRLGYRFQYKRTNFDEINEKKQTKYGFRTTNVTRLPMISELVTIVRESSHLINDISTLDEMLAFIRNKDGRPEAASGKHDDCVMSLAIAYKSRNQQSMSIQEDTVHEPDYGTSIGGTGY